MKLNYSLNSGFTSGDGSVPTRENTASWIAWVPVRAGDLSADVRQGSLLSTIFYLAPRSISGLGQDALLLGIPVGELGVQIDPSLNPQHLSYADASASASPTLSVTEPVALDAVRVVAARDGQVRRQAEKVLADLPGQRQFHVMPELFEA